MQKLRRGVDVRQFPIHRAKFPIGYLTTLESWGVRFRALERHSRANHCTVHTAIYS